MAVISVWTFQHLWEVSCSPSPCSRSRIHAGGPGYSGCPHIHLVTSSSGSPSSSSCSSAFVSISFSISVPRRLRRGACGSDREFEAASSCDSDLLIEDSRGDCVRFAVLVFRVREFEDVEDGVGVGTGGGCEVVPRARTDLLWLILKIEECSRRPNCPQRFSSLFQVLLEDEVVCRSSDQEKWRFRVLNPDFRLSGTV